MKTKILVDTKTIKIADIDGLKLNKSDIAVYSYLFSTKYSADNYTDMPEEIQTLLLPLKPLFWELEVWTSDKIADPILVGIKQLVTFHKDFPELNIKRGVTLMSASEKEKLESLKEGYDKDYTAYTSDRTPYLLAQWGAEIFPIEELTKKAIELFTREKRVSLIKEKNSIQTQLDLIDDLVIEHFRGNSNAFSNYPF